MVAPHVETQLTRSLVRVPNSGRDTRAGSILHDLSRVSSAAALVPITSYLAVGMMPSGASTRPPSSPFPTDEDKSPMKLSSGGVPPARPRAAAGNSPLQVGTIAPGVWSRANSGAGMVSRDGYRSGSFVPLRASTSTVSAGVNPAGGRKRSLPVMMQDATRTTAEKIKSPKVPRATTVKSTQQPRRPAPRRRAGVVPTTEHLLRERDELRAENLALKQQLFRRLQQRIASGAGPVGL